MALLTIEGVGKEYRARGKQVVALDGIDLNIAEGEFVTIVGPSGCGKSTLLNLIVGLLRASRGSISFRGAPIDGICTKIGYVTQKDNLLPWRTLVENVEIALEIRGGGCDAAQEAGAGFHRARRPGRFRRALSARTFRRHAPARQYYPHADLRSGINSDGRAVRPARRADRIVLQDQLLQLWSATKKTIIFITHDLVEAITLADRVVLMSSRPGRIKSIEAVNIARPRDVFQIHQSAEFRAVYERLWQQLRPEVKLAEV